MKLRDRLNLIRAPIEWANDLVVREHYLHRPVHWRAHPFAYRVELDSQTCGVIVMATPHWTKQKRLFGYPGLPTKWQVLVVSRVWLDPCVQLPQLNGHANNVASCALGQMLKRVQYDWLEHHPPVFPDEPYHIRLIIAHADTSVGHEGVIYKAANFELWGETKNSRKRHTTRGEDNGARKLIYIYRLKKPRWEPEFYYQVPLLIGEHLS